MSSTNTPVESATLQPKGLRFWLALWAIILAPLCFRVFVTWHECLSRMQLSDCVLPVSACAILVYAVFRFKKTSPTFAVCRSRFGLFFLSVMCALNVFGTYFHFSRLFWFSAIGMFAGLLWAVAGGKYFRHWLPVFLFSLTAIPGAPASAESHLSTSLQLLSAKIATGLASLFIPVTASGTVFCVNNSTFEVAPACSGLPMMSTLMFFVLLWNVFDPTKLRVMLQLIAIAAVVALAMNGLRLFLMALVAHWHSMDAALSMHTNIEFLFFPLAMFLLWKYRRFAHV